jgi:hypothetical protein
MPAIEEGNSLHEDYDSLPRDRMSNACFFNDVSFPLCLDEDVNRLYEACVSPY